MADKNKEEDFVRDRLVPFCIGLAVTVGLSVLYAILYGASLALIAAGGFSTAISGSPFGVFTGMFIGIPLWLLIIGISFAFWVLTTWLLGQWTREKYRNYKRGRMEKRAEHETDAYDAWLAEKRRKEAQEQEAEWEKEWIMMKKRARENSSSEKPKKKTKADSELPHMEETDPAKEEPQ